MDTHFTSTDILSTLHPLTQTQRRAWYKDHRADADAIASVVRHCVVTAWECGLCVTDGDVRAHSTGHLSALLGLDPYALPESLSAALSGAVATCRPREVALAGRHLRATLRSRRWHVSAYDDRSDVVLASADAESLEAAIDACIARLA